MGRVVFIVPSEDVGRRVRKILGDSEVYVLPSWLCDSLYTRMRKAF